jgi:Tol biopolymer transport system component
LLAAGSRVGPYEVVAPLGAGGMGEVYRARDPRLGRDVALKVLPDDAAGDAERLRRFQHEARAVASLNHPHILAVHDVGSDDGVAYVVFELLDGATLRRRVEAGPIPARKVVEYGVQICRGLSAAHARGIVHRDLKPENVFLTSGDDVKILDFGLAKETGRIADADSLTRAPTHSAVTEAGRVLGTPGYMSPEQAQGQRADARSDLFALGAILYELLSGRRAFAGSTPVDTMAAVLRSDPPEIDTADVPPGLDRIVRRCLEKDPRERFQSAHDLRLALEALSVSVPGKPPSKRRLPSLRSTAGVLAVLGVMAVAAGTWRLWSRGHERRTAGSVRIVPLTADGGSKFAPRLSPDGERVAYSWTGPANDNWDVYVKAIGQGTSPLRLTENKASDWGPVWSPDGRRITFVRELDTGAVIYTVPSFGGQERRLADVVGRIHPSLSWSPDGDWLALSEKTSEQEPAHIVRLSLATLQKEVLTFPPADSRGDLHPEISPDGRELAFVRAASRVWGQQDVWVQQLDQPKARQLTFAKYTHCSGLAWTADSADVLFSTTDGYAAGGRMFRIPHEGGVPVPLAGIGSDVTGASLRGSRLVHAQLTPSPSAIWRIPGRRSSVADRTPKKLIASQWNESAPDYSPDGRRILFVSGRSGLETVWLSGAEGENPVQLVSFAATLANMAKPWSPDGRRIAFTSNEAGNWDIYLVDAEGGRPQRVTHEPSAEVAATFSRDARWIYFSSDRTGRVEIWRMPAAGGPAVQVTRNGGFYVQESRDSRFLYYSGATERGIWRVPVDGGEETLVLRDPGELSGWKLSRTGIYYATAHSLAVAGDEYRIRFLDVESGRTETLFRTTGLAGHWNLAVSPDENWILYTEFPFAPSELVLVENFR